MVFKSRRPSSAQSFTELDLPDGRGPRRLQRGIEVFSLSDSSRKGNLLDSSNPMYCPVPRQFQSIHS